MHSIILYVQDYYLNLVIIYCHAHCAHFRIRVERSLSLEFSAEDHDGELIYSNLFCVV